MSEDTTAVILAPNLTPAIPGPQAETVVRSSYGVNVGGNTVTQATEHLPEDQKHLVRWLHTHARNQNWDWPTFQAETGIDRTTAFRVFTDSYRYPEFEYFDEKTADGKTVRMKRPHPRARQRISLDNLCEKIAKHKAIYEARQEVFSAGFVKTSIWPRVEWLCKKVFIRQKMGFLYGPSQIGKTTTLMEFARQNNHGQTIYVAIPPGASAQMLLRCIARALHVNTRNNYEMLLENIIEALDKDKLLILDEVHLIFTTYLKRNVMRCMEVIRYIHDQTKCGLIVSGTNVFRDQLREGEFFQFLKQLQRRGLYEVQLPEDPPRSDLDLISEHYGLEPARGEAEEILLHIAKADGFGVVCTRLTDAKELADKAKETLQWKHFVKAYHIIRKLALGGAK